MKAKYICGYPYAVLPVLRREVIGNLLILGVGVVLGFGWWAADLPTASPLWGKLASWVLGFYALSCLLFVIWAVANRFSLRLVPQFERPPEFNPDTYSYGKYLLRNLEKLDQLATAGGLTLLSDLGVIKEGWFDCTVAQHTILNLIKDAESSHLGFKVVADLKRINQALGNAKNTRFRLVIVSGNVMNARFRAYLHEKGFC